ncbi:hypothetical protein B4U79_13260, partial [Dinothrombium tinctorium]
QPPLYPLITLAYTLPFITTGTYAFVRYFFEQTSNDFTQYAISISNSDESGAKEADNFVVQDLDNTDLTLTIDGCWLLPSRISWHEWIINAPNLAVLIRSVQERVEALIDLFSVI